jgi:hypothetical protein
MAKKPESPKPSPPDAWQPPAGCIVSDAPEGERTYHLRVGGVRYVHVSDAPDGRWVYQPD